MLRKQTGVALVELALILPLLLVLTFITTEFSRALFQYNTLAKSVRDAARYLSIQNPGTRITEAKNLVVYGGLANTGTPVAFGLTLGQVPDPTWATAGAGPAINTVTIKVSGCATSAAPCYRFSPLFASVFGLNFGNINFADISATMRSPT